MPTQLTQHDAEAVLVDVDEGIGIPVHERPPHQRVDEPAHGHHEERPDVARRDQSARAEDDPAHQAEQRHDDVQQLVGQQVGSVEVEQRTQEEPVHDPAADREHQRVQPQRPEHPSLRPLGVGGEHGRRTGHEHVEPDRQVAGEPHQPGAEVGVVRLGHARLGVEVLPALDDQDQLQHHGARRNEERHQVERARVGGRPQSHGATIAVGRGATTCDARPSRAGGRCARAAGRPSPRRPQGRRTRGAARRGSSRGPGRCGGARRRPGR